jgi:hypothetical protein
MSNQTHYRQPKPPFGKILIWLFFILAVLVVTFMVSASDYKRPQEAPGTAAPVSFTLPAPEKAAPLPTATPAIDYAAQIAAIDAE